MDISRCKFYFMKKMVVFLKITVRLKVFLRYTCMKRVFTLIMFVGSFYIRDYVDDWKTNRITTLIRYLGSINLSRDEARLKYPSSARCQTVSIALLVSRFKSHRSDISSGSSVNLISDTTGNRSFLRLYPRFLVNIYIHFTPPNNGAHRSHADRSFSSNFSPFTRER